MFVKIKVGFFVGQDHGYFEWPEEYKDFVFKAEKFGEKRLYCYRNGFGEKGNYGNGGVFVNREFTIKEKNINFLITEIERKLEI